MHYCPSQEFNFLVHIPDRLSMPVRLLDLIQSPPIADPVMLVTQEWLLS